MIYDLKNPYHKKQFKERVNKLFSQGKKVELTDKTIRSLSQNAYLHCLIRITAMETGVTETYAKEEYFKRLANKELFEKSVLDPITSQKTTYLDKSSNLTIPEMSTAIDRFRMWASEQGIYLPEASADDDGNMTFSSDDDKEAFEQAIVETGRLSNYL